MFSLQSGAAGIRTWAFPSVVRFMCSLLGCLWLRFTFPARHLSTIWGDLHPPHPMASMDGARHFQVLISGIPFTPPRSLNILNNPHGYWRFVSFRVLNTIFVLRFGKVRFSRVLAALLRLLRICVGDYGKIALPSVRE